MTDHDPIRTGGPNTLDGLAGTIRSEIARGRTAAIDAIEAHLNVGIAYNEARALLPDNRAFGPWIKAQHFGMHPKALYRAGVVARDVDAARAAIAALRADHGEDFEITLSAVYRTLTAPPDPQPITRADRVDIAATAADGHRPALDDEPHWLDDPFEVEALMRKPAEPKVVHATVLDVSPPPKVLHARVRKPDTDRDARAMADAIERGALAMVAALEAIAEIATREYAPITPDVLIGRLRDDDHREYLRDIATTTGTYVAQIVKGIAR